VVIYIKQNEKPTIYQSSFVKYVQEVYNIGAKKC